MSGDEVYLRHILDAIHRIESYISKGRESFLSDQMPQDAVMRQLEVIGEAVKQISAATRQARPHVRWRDIAGMRDILIHQYFAVDVEQVWEVTQRDLLELRQEVERMLAED